MTIGLAVLMDLEHEKQKGLIVAMPVSCGVVEWASGESQIF